MGVFVVYLKGFTLLSKKYYARRMGGLALVAATAAAGLSFGGSSASAAELGSEGDGSVSASGTVVGKMVFTAGPVAYVNDDGFQAGRNVAVTYAPSYEAAFDNAAFFYFPAHGTTGPVRSFNNPNFCLQTVLGGAAYENAYAVRTCDGSQLQKFYLSSVGNGYQLIADIAGTTKGGAYTTILSQGQSSKLFRVYSENAAGFPAANLSVFAGAVSDSSVQDRSATISGRAVPGATVVLKWNGVSQQVTADEAGAWSYTIDKLKLGSNPVRLEQWLGAEKTAESDLDAELAVAELTASAEFGTSLGENARVSGKAQPGATVQIREGSVTGSVVATAEADASGDYAVSVPAPNVGGGYVVHVNQVITGEQAGDVAVTIDYGAAVALTSPVNDSVTQGGNVHFIGTGRSDSRIEVRESGTSKVVAVATVLPNGSWNTVVNVPEGGTTRAYEVTQLSQGNNVTTTQVRLNPDGAPVTPITLTAPAAGATVSDTKRPVFSGTGEPGHTVTVSGSSGRPIVITAVGADGKWSAPAMFDFANGTYIGTATQTGDKTVASFLFHVADASTVAPLALTAPATDASVNGPRPVFTGTGHPGAQVNIKGSTGRVIGSTTVTPGGTWSVPVNLNLSAGRYVGTVVQTAGTNVKTVNYAFNVISSAITPVTLTSPTIGGTAVGPYPVFIGTGHPGATIEVKGSSGRLVGSGKVDASGKYQVTSSIALPTGGFYLGTVVQTSGADVKTANYNFHLVADIKGLEITSPTEGSTITHTQRPTFTGKGVPGALIQVKGTANVIAETTVDAYGEWSATSTMDLGNQTRRIAVVMTPPTGSAVIGYVTFTINASK